MMRPTIKVLALMEATTVSGPAKNLIEFGRRARALDGRHDELPAVEVSIVTFHRGGHAADVNGEGRQGARSPEAPNKFVAAARAAGLEADVLAERFRFDTRVVAQLREVVARRRPDVVQTHQVKSHFLMKLSGLWRRHPWIAFHHGYTTTDLKMRVYNHVNRWSLPTADRVVTVCESFARDLSRAGVDPRRIAVLHNSVEAPRPPGAEAESGALRARLGLGAGERVVLAVGRLSHEKGHVDLVRAAARLRGERPEVDFKVVVVGDGPERQRVEREAAALNFGAGLIFAGHVTDVRPFYALADVLALPSHSEGSPNVLLEAMAAGLPVVATRVGGVPEIVAHEESALLVGPRDSRAMAEALGRSLSDHQFARELAGRASALAATRFSPESYRRSLVEIYRELISSPEAAAKARVARARVPARPF